MVMTPSGSFVTMDNTRLAVARELGMTRVPATVRGYNDPLPASRNQEGTFGNATTWGQALEHRLGRNRLGSEGTSTPPRMSGTPAQSQGGFGGWLNRLLGQ